MQKLAGIGIVLESRLSDLDSKGVLGAADAIYNPGDIFERVVLLSPYQEDVRFSHEGREVFCHGGRLRYPWTLPLAVWRIWMILRRRHISVLRGSNAFLGSLIGILASRIAGIPNVVWLGGDNRLAQAAVGRWYYGSRWLTNAIEYAVLRLADVVVVPNKFTAHYVAEVAGARIVPKVSIIPWAAEKVPEREMNHIDIRANFNLPCNLPIVAVVGVLNRYKFTHILYAALCEGPLEGPNGPATVVFCGDGELRKEGEQRFGERADVRFIGFQKRRIVRSLLREASVVCIPMSGMVLLEAASLGRPVIASCIEWHPELIENEETGILVDPNDATGWRSAIIRLLCDKESAERMASNLRTRYNHGYAFETVTEKLANLYCSICKSRTT